MAVKAGALRFNTDSNKLELFDGNQWTQIVATSPEAQTGGTRGIIWMGYSPSGFTNRIDRINVDSTGNATDFGDTIQPQESNDQACSSRTRGLLAGGANPSAYSPASRTDTIQYVTISSDGNSADFGNLQSTKYGCAGVSDSTRGIWMGGDTPTYVNEIDYVTIASTGNANDFGNLSSVRSRPAGMNSSTRAVIALGSAPSPVGSVNTIEFITISTQGNSSDFGDATYTQSQVAGASNSVRGIFGAGVNELTLNYITLATLGDAIDYGDLITERREVGACASPTRWVIAGGYDDSPGARLDSIEYTQFATTGNTIDFGDLSVARSGTSACSNGHGGL
jgi:hypothetical protein